MFRCIGVQVFWCSGLMTFWKVKRVTREGRPKNGENFGWGKFSTFWASSSAKKVLLTAEKGESAQN